MSLKALRSLVAIADYGSFAAAADKLALTQAAMSLQVKALENNYGVTLFDRVGRSPVLNANGRLVLDKAREVLNLYDGLGEGFGEDNIYSGQLNIGAIHSIQLGPLAPALAQLHAAHPQLKINVCCGMSEELALRVEKGALDVVFITEPISPRGAPCQWRTLATEPFYLVAGPDVSACNDRQILAEEPFIRLDRIYWAGSIIHDELQKRQIVPNEIMLLDSLKAALTMVEYGLGVTILPLNDSQRLVLAGQYQLTPFGEPQLTRNVGSYQQQAHRRRPLAELVIDAMAKHIHLSKF